MADATDQTTQTGTVQPAGGGDSAFPPFDSSTFPSQLFWFAIVFVVLYLTMSKAALPRVASIFETRRKRITSDLDEANALQRRADDAGAAYEKTLAEAKANAQALAQGTRDKLAADSEARRKTLEADLHDKLTAAEAQIADVKAQAMGNVESIARDTASAIVEHLSGPGVGADEIAKAVSAARAG